MLTVDSLAQEIRRVDGNNSLGAGALAEALMPFLEATGEARPVVKPLDWEERSGAHYADTAFGEACIDVDGDGAYVIESGRKHSGFASVDAAKAFVQKHHDIWVNDWLAVPAAAPGVVTEATISGMVSVYNRVTGYAFPQASDKEQREAMRAVYASLSPAPVSEGLVTEALETARQFIASEYSSSRAAVTGEWLEPEARPVYAKIVDALTAAPLPTKGGE